MAAASTIQKETGKRRREDEGDGPRASEDVTVPPPTSTTIDQSSSSGAIPTVQKFIAKSEEFLTLPEELNGVDFTNRVFWRKYAPYSDNNNNTPLPCVPNDTPPVFSSKYPALCFHVNAICGRARATTLSFPRKTNNDHYRQVQTPIFMPVGTKGTIKSLTTEEICNSEEGALNCPIILSNTYHLALQPKTELVRDMGGLHQFMGWDRAILTDSGGFQMVSLLKLAEITEEGVTFENPFSDEAVETINQGDRPNNDNNNNYVDSEKLSTSSERMLLRPEDSINHQNNIGSDIMMALDDVVSSTADDTERFTIATYRTLRWLDRCYAAHQRPKEQNLFAIVQGGLDTSMGGLREKCLAGFRARDDQIPGYAIGGLAGGETKEKFWQVVDQCCKALPDDKPRYLMGVGYPLDLVVCTALGVDMYDCVYPTRTARFGVALVPGESPGTMRLKANEYASDTRVIMEGCECAACKGGYSRARLHALLKSGNPLAAALITSHNIAYMMNLVRGMRKAIFKDQYGDFAKAFVSDQFRGKENGGQDIPAWVKDALSAADITV